MSERHGSDMLRPGVLIPFLVVAAIWGSTWVVIKDQVGVVPAGWTVTYRFALATVGMTALALVRREDLRLSRQGLGIAAIVGCAQFCCNFQFVYRAEQHLTSGLVAVIYALLMVPNALLARLVLKQPIHGRFLTGSAVAIGGIALLLLHEYRIAPPTGRVLLGVALSIGGLLSASVSNIAQASEPGKRQAVVPLIAWAMLLGTAVDAALSWAVSGPPVFDTRPGFWLGTSYLAFIGSVVTFPLYFALIRNVGAGRAAYNGVVVPMVAMAISTVVEDYRWTWLAIGGAALALAGLVIALSGRSPSAAKTAASPSRKVA